ncbi:probable RNA-binding protein ARP1 [Zingiber officinale]|uniref:probable RNA-binding protein ARP1 n=1 Tax=Zingiber officinale TaxID=94328 RepID=UPI001C4BCF6E|nr:probable RNA-binding protein ARP1 [Zingiber officinale]
MGQQFGDTTLTKVFVGGLAWETREEAMREHFDRFGDILEAVIISDKHTGRSKGYGFVTFKEAEAAKHACEDATPVINGRRANCNLASLGAKRAGHRPEPPSTRVPLSAHSQHHQPPPDMAMGPRGVSSAPPPPTAAAQWYYRVPSITPPPSSPPPFQLHHYHNALPFYPTAGYRYSPRCITDFSYNGRMGHTGGLVAAAGTMPVYPLYQFQQHQPPFFHAPNATTAVATVPSAIQPAPPTDRSSQFNHGCHISL